MLEVGGEPPAVKRSVSTTLFSWFFYIFLAYTLLMVMPGSFQGTAPYLDSSWGYSLNYFVHSRFRFGPDLIFTYGPLGLLNNPQHVGNDIPIAIAVHAVFWIALGVQLILVWSSGQRAITLTFCMALVLGHRLYYDYWDYSLVALSLLTVIKLLRCSANYFDLCLVPALLGITFLLKFTAFSMLVLMLGVYTAHLLFRHSMSRGQAGWLIMCLLIGPFAYFLYDPSLQDLIQYVKGALQIAAGFAAAMSTESASRDLELAATVWALLLINIVLGFWNRRLRGSEVLLIALVTWNAFRFGFVRGDSSHTAQFFGLSFLVFACLFVGWLGMPRLPELVLLASSIVFVIAAVSGLSVRYPVLVSSNWWPSQSWRDLEMMRNWKSLYDNLDHGSDNLFAALPGMAFRNSIQGQRVMVFPVGTPYVAKINFEMFPLYALQDYAAYTPYLDRKGARNLVEAKPQVEKVIVEWVSVDGRNQMLDTPATSLALLSDFMLARRVPEALLLTRRPAALPIALRLIGHQPFSNGEWVRVPSRDQLVAMSINLKQTFAGALITSLYAQQPIYLDLQTDSGAPMRFRVPPQTLRTPGLINFVPQSLDELANLWNPQPLQNRVNRIRLSGPGLRWTDSKGYDFYRVDNAGVKLGS